MCCFRRRGANELKVYLAARVAQLFSPKHFALIKRVRFKGFFLQQTWANKNMVVSLYLCMCIIILLHTYTDMYYYTISTLIVLLFFGSLFQSSMKVF